MLRAHADMHERARSTHRQCVADYRTHHCARGTIVQGDGALPFGFRQQAIKVKRACEHI